MRPLLNVDSIIYFYLFICGALLLFNVCYILRTTGKSRAMARRESAWEGTLLQWFAAFPTTEHLTRRNERLLMQKLRRTEELVAMSEVLDHWFEGREREIYAFMAKHSAVFRQLALSYGKKSAMERAFYAYFIASYYPPLEEHGKMLVEILLTYLEDSTVYCRENVLNALYALGNERAVEHALQLLNDRDWYHHTRLLSDGFARFSGDRVQLVHRLWRHRGEWMECITVAVVQFAASLSAEFSADFLSALELEHLPLEVRFGLVRYFQRHIYGAAHPVLLRFLASAKGGDSGLAIAAASALASYPGEATMRGLKESLHSRDWYVRHNAAASMIAIGLSEEDRTEIMTSGDMYAVEMLEYVLEQTERRTRRAPKKEEVCV